jgi:hypothetical protein
MASLSITGLSFDQAVYSPGETITLTVTYTSDDFTAASITSTAAVTVTDASTSASQSAPFSVADGTQAMLPVTVSATDDRATPGTWAVQSDTVAGSGPWTGTAVLTSTA